MQNRPNKCFLFRGKHILEKKKMNCNQTQDIFRLIPQKIRQWARGIQRVVLQMLSRPCIDISYIKKILKIPQDLNCIF